MLFLFFVGKWWFIINGFLPTHRRNHHHHRSGLWVCYAYNGCEAERNERERKKCNVRWDDSWTIMFMSAAFIHLILISYKKPSIFSSFNVYNASVFHMFMIIPHKAVRKNLLNILININNVTCSSWWYRERERMQHYNVYMKAKKLFQQSSSRSSKNFSFVTTHTKYNQNSSFCGVEAKAMARKKNFLNYSTFIQQKLIRKRL